MRVAVAEDSVLLREGLSRLLGDGGFDVVGRWGNAEDLLTRVRHDPPDVAILDIRLPPTHTDEGMRAALHLRERHPGVGVLVLSQYVEVGLAMKLLADSAEGVGYLLKDRIAHAATLADALHRLVAGECVVDPTIVSRLLARARVHNPLDDLTPREREVLSLMAEGRSNATIGRLLSLQPKTVETHVSRVFSKLGLAEEADGHRRVLAVLAHLRAESP